MANSISKNAQKTGEGGAAALIATILAVATGKLIKNDEYTASLTVAYTAVILGVYNFVKHTFPRKKKAVANVK